MAKRTSTSDKCKNDWLFLAISVVAGIQVAILVTEWLRRTARKEQIEARQRLQNRPAGSPVAELPMQRSLKSNARNKHDTPNLPSPIIKNLYLEITNIAQGVNIAIFVYVITRPDFLTSLKIGRFSAPLFAVANFLAVVVFWTRYYLDTEILNRSFTVMSTCWFFAYAVAQGVSIGLIDEPCAWLGSTSVFLFFGAGFYVLNLREIRRKQKAGIVPEWPEFVNWQAKRMIDLIVLSLLGVIGTFLVTRYPALAFLAAICALIVAMWQLTITRDYSKLGFLRTGV